MHYELVAQCKATEKCEVIQEIEMSGGKIRDILEDQDNLLLFIEYDEPLQKKLHWLETLSNLVTQIGETIAVPATA